MAAKKEPAPTTGTEKKFTKEQLLGADKYRHQHDLLSALLTDGQRYSLAEVDKRVQEFLKKEM